MRVSTVWIRSKTPSGVWLKWHLARTRSGVYPGWRTGCGRHIDDESECQIVRNADGLTEGNVCGSEGCLSMPLPPPRVDDSTAERYPDCTIEPR